MSTLNELLTDLRQPVPPASLRVKEDRDTLIYLPWYTAAGLADERVGGAWSYHIVDHWIDDVPRGSSGNYTPTPLAHVRVCVTVVGSDASVSREAVGVDDDPNGQRGTPFERATGAGLRRALATFGLGRELYDKATTARLLAEVKAGPQQAPAQPAQAAPRPTNGAAKPAGKAPRYAAELQPVGNAEGLAAILEALASAQNAFETDEAKARAKTMWRTFSKAEQAEITAAVKHADETMASMIPATGTV